MVRLVVLNDNEEGSGLLNEWGWSIYVETNNTRFIFDANTDYRVIEHNSKKLNVDLSKIDYAVLSHWHRDHYGGFPAVARVQRGLTVFSPTGPVSILTRVGLNVVVVEDLVETSDGVVILPPMYSEDTGLHEIAASVPSRKGRILIVGCSHPGVDRIVLEHIERVGEKPYMIIGGFHNPGNERIDKLARLVEGPICAAHCSGDRAKKYIETVYSDKACRVRTGSIITI